MADESHDLNTAEVARAGDAGRMPHREQLINRAASSPPAGGHQGASGVAHATPPATLERERVAPPVPHRGIDNSHPGLLPASEAERFKTEWSEIQAVFVDTPRAAVERADALVATVMKRTAEVFAAEHATLEHQWDTGETVTTEDLRLVLQRYRAFFDRLLSV